MSEAIPFSKKCLRKDSLIMLDCPTRKSILRLLRKMKRKGLKVYTGRRWAVTYQHSDVYAVVDNASGVRYYAVDYEDTWMGYHGFSVYKLEET